MDFAIYGRRGPLDSLKMVSRGVGTYSTPGKAIPRIFQKSTFWASGRGSQPGGALPTLPPCALPPCITSPLAQLQKLGFMGLQTFNKKVLELTRDCHRKGKIVAAICHGPWILISAGLVKGKKVCGYDAVHDDLINAGAKLLNVPAIRDGNIITGRVPDDLPEFCLEISKALSD